MQVPSLADPNRNAEPDWDFTNPMYTKSYASLLQACTHIKSLEILHTHLIISGLEQSPFLGAKLVTMYTMFGCIEDARHVFDKIHEQDVVLWNVMLRMYARAGGWFYREWACL